MPYSLNKRPALIFNFICQEHLLSYQHRESHIVLWSCTLPHLNFRLVILSAIFSSNGSGGSFHKFCFGFSQNSQTSVFGISSQDESSGLVGLCLKLQALLYCLFVFLFVEQTLRRRLPAIRLFLKSYRKYLPLFACVYGEQCSIVTFRSCPPMILSLADNIIITCIAVIGSAGFTNTLLKCVDNNQACI